MARGSDSEIEISSPDTQFIPKEGDEENLWSVIEITAENAKAYKVRWDGFDPKTKKPWPQSWVPKHDCTDDIVQEWKIKQAKSRKKAAKKASARRETKPKSSISSTVSRATPSTTSTLTAKRKSTSATLPQDDDEPERVIKVKRKRTSAPSTSSRTEDPVPSTRPKKKRKVEDAKEGSPSQNPSSYDVRPSRVTKVLYKEDDDEINDENENPQGANGKAINPIPLEVDSDYDSIPVRPPPNKITRYFGDSEADVAAKSHTKAKGKGKEKDSIISPTAGFDDDADDIPLPKKGKKSVEKEPQTKRSWPASHLAFFRPASRNAKAPFIARNNSHDDAEENGDVSVVLPLRRTRPNKMPSPDDSDKNPSTPAVNPLTTSRLKRWKVTDNMEEIPLPPPRKPLASKSSLTSRKTAKPHKLSTPIIKPGRNSDGPGAIQPTSSPPPAPENKKDHIPEEDNWDNPGPMEDELPQPSPRALERLDVFDNIVSPVRPVAQEVQDNGMTTDEDVEQGDNERNSVQYATPSPKPPANGRTSSYKHDDSYPNDVVPETEPENTESQESRPEASAGAQPLTPARPTLKSKMKPKTPGGSRTSVIDDNPHSPHLVAAEPSTRTAKLAPIPVMSPSTFAPLLPSSNINNSTIESADAEDEPMSSIEQFDSPVKSSLAHKDPVLSGIYSEIDKDWDALNQKGEMIAENARKERLKAIQADVRTKISLENIVKVTSSTREKVVTPREPVDSRALQELEDAYVDLNGGENMDVDEPQGSGEAEHSEHLREEEEESTQDIIQDMEMERRMSDADAVGWHHPDPDHNQNQEDQPQPQEPQPEEDLAPDAKQDVHQRNDIDVDADDSLEVAAHLSTQESNPLPSRETHSPLQVYPEENTHDAEEEIPATEPTKARASSSRRTSYSEASDEFRYNHPVAMNLLNIKSNEIARLEQLLAEALRKNTTLTTEYMTIEKALVDFQSHEQDPKLGLELEEARSALTTERQAWVTERQAWVTERQKQLDELEAAKALAAEGTRKKVAAEERATLFETHYHKATAFVTSVREENAELEKRAQIAEGQAQTGVASAKAFFEKRMKDLEADLTLWKNTTRFVLEKDSRTNDEVRRRAAEAPELEARCGRLEDKLEMLYDKISELEEEVSNKNDELDSMVAEKDVWSREVNRLNEAMLEMTAKNEELAREHNLVYRCEWRINNDQDSCDAIFLTIQDLQNHMFTGGHLKDPNS